MNKSELLKIAAPTINEIEVEGIGKLKCRAFPALAGWTIAQQIQNAGEDRQKVIDLLVDVMTMLLLNEDGSPMFTTDERDSIVGQLGFDAVTKIGSAILQTLNTKTVETTEKN